MSRALIDSTYEDARFHRELLRIAQVVIGIRPWTSATPVSLVQESFVRLRQARKLQLNDGLHVRRVAARVMMWIVADRAKRRWRTPMVSLSDAGDDTVALWDFRAERTIEEDIAVEHLLSEYRLVDDKAADAFALRWVGYKDKEIAEALGKSTSQVERYHERARRWLAGRLRLDTQG